jgi:S1-C subfamily serine protease
MSVPRILVLPFLLVACATTSKSTSTTAPTSAPTKPKTAKVETAPSSPLTQEEAFALAMPATVLVTTAWGHGTGVFIDPSGLVLTNYHVVATGKNEDFGISATVTIPERQPDGSVKPGERFSAVAYKIDEKRDLAILKIDGKGRKFPSMEITEKDPQPGAKVFALGNAGVGLGWALKRCSINAIGDAQAQVSAIFQMQRDDISAEERKMSEEAIKKAAAEGGMQIQSDCTILPGDSGGPLVDETTGKIVGLNVAIRTAFSSYVSLGSLAFHIHAQELRDFSKVVPKGPQVFLPDPWVSAGAYGALTDFDQDGEIDSLSVMGPCGENLTCNTSFADVDENSFKGKKTLPTFAEIQTSKAFEAELAILRQARMPRKPSGFMVPVSDTLAWIDTDDDGSFDKLIVADGETGGVRGYKLGGERPERDASLDGTSVANLSALYTKESLRPAVARFATALVTGTVDLGDPAQMKATKARLADYSADKKPDTLHVDTRLDKRVLVDVDQTGLEKLGSAVARASAATRGKVGRRAPDFALVKQLRDGKVHGDMLAVLGAPTRVYYDTDHDGDFDLVLEGASLDSGVALGAATIDNGRPTTAMEHVGRRLLRPGLLGDKARAAKLEVILGKAFPGSPHANAKDDATSFAPALPVAPLSASPVGEFGTSVLSIYESDAVVILLDLDKNSFKGKNAKKDPLEVVKAGKFDAEVSLRFANGIALVSFDSNDDGKFDTVFVTSGWDPKRITLAYKLTKKGTEVDKSKEGAATFDAKHVKNAAQAKFLKEVTAKLFP